MKTNWVGASMTNPPISEPYQQTVGAFAEMIRDSSGYEALPNAELAVCPDADHAAPIGARAGVFAAAIRDFAVRHSGS